MTPTIFLTDNDFRQIAQLTVQDGAPPGIGWLNPRPMEDVPATYLWLAMHEHGFETLYVGGTSKGPYIRHRTGHQPSWTGDGTGRQNAEMLRSYANAFPDAKLRIYARESTEMHVFGQAVKATWLEEAALIRRLEPLFNRAHVNRRNRLEANPGAEAAGGVMAAGAAAVDAAGEAHDALRAPEGAAVVRPVVVDVLADEHVCMVTDGEGATLEFDARSLLRGEAVTEFLMSIQPDRQALFIRILEFLAGFYPLHRQKVVGYYRQQPKGYDLKPMLVFAHRLTAGDRARHWYGRLPLVDSDEAPLTAIFHPSLLQQGVDARVQIGSEGAWRPNDIGHLIDHPNLYFREWPPG